MFNAGTLGKMDKQTINLWNNAVKMTQENNSSVNHSDTYRIMYDLLSEDVASMDMSQDISNLRQEFLLKSGLGIDRNKSISKIAVDISGRREQLGSMSFDIQKYSSLFNKTDSLNSDSSKCKLKDLKLKFDDTVFKSRLKDVRQFREIMEPEPDELPPTEIVDLTVETAKNQRKPSLVFERQKVKPIGVKRRNSAFSSPMMTRDLEEQPKLLSIQPAKKLRSTEAEVNENVRPQKPKHVPQKKEKNIRHDEYEGGKPPTVFKKASEYCETSSSRTSNEGKNIPVYQSVK